MIVNGGAAEIDGGSAQAIIGLGAHRVLADANGIIDRHAAIAAVAVPVRAGAAISPGADSRRLALPEDVEGVAFRAVIGIVNADHSGAAAARVAYQFLGAAAVHALEAEIRGIGRHGRVTFKAAPLRRLTEHVAKESAIAADFHFGRSVHHHFDGAFAFRAAATGKICSSLYGLGVGNPAQKP